MLLFFAIPLAKDIFAATTKCYKSAISLLALGPEINSALRLHCNELVSMTFLLNKKLCTLATNTGLAVSLELCLADSSNQQPRSRLQPRASSAQCSCPSSWQCLCLVHLPSRGLVITTGRPEPICWRGARGEPEGRTRGEQPTKPLHYV